MASYRELSGVDRLKQQSVGSHFAARHNHIEFKFLGPPTKKKQRI